MGKSAHGFAVWQKEVLVHLVTAWKFHFWLDETQGDRRKGYEIWEAPDI